MLRNKILQLVPILMEEPVNVRKRIAREIGKSEIQIARYYRGAPIPDDTKIALAAIITKLGVKCKIKDFEKAKPVKAKLNFKSK